MTHLLRSLIRETLLLEEVYGAQAVVYHGTKADPQELISALLNDEFRPGEGSGAMYGKGLYTVYDPEGARTMTGSYGKSVIKLKVNLYGYIIFDPDTARVVYGSSLTPAEQAQKLGYSLATIKALKDLSSDELSGKYTSDAALKVYRSIKNEVKGIAFTGKNDGRVVVVYDPTTAVPIAWKRVGGEWQKVDRTQGVFKSAIRRFATGDYKEGKYENSDLKLLRSIYRLPINKRIVTGSLDLSETEITTLPAGLKVGGNLNLKHSKIAQLPADLKVDGDLDIADTKITSIPASIQIGGGLNLTDLKITSFPENFSVGGSIVFGSTTITSLPAGLKVGGMLYISGTPLTSLPARLHVEKDFWLSYTNISYLPDDLHVGGDLLLYGTDIISLPASLKVGGRIMGFRGNLSNVPEALKEKIK